MNVERINEETKEIIYKREDHEAYEEINRVIIGRQKKEELIFLSATNNDVYCLANHKMEFIKDPYNNSATRCNVCMQMCGDDIVYNCKGCPGYNGGYDICNNCAKKQVLERRSLPGATFVDEEEEEDSDDEDFERELKRKRDCILILDH